MTEVDFIFIAGIILGICLVGIITLFILDFFFEGGIFKAKDKYSYIFPKFCKNCKYSKPDNGSSWAILCYNPHVNATNPYALGGGENTSGSSCTSERGNIWGVCGKKGKLWEPK